MSTAYTGVKPRLSLAQIVNMSVRFWDPVWLGPSTCQYGQFMRTSDNPDEVPILFLAAPLTS
jgi:hypothetical protein